MVKDKTVALSYGRILEGNYFLKADRDAYTYLVDSLLQQKYRLVTQQKEVYSYFPQYDKLFWRTDVKCLIEGVTAAGKVPAGMVVHQGVHALFNQRFKDASAQDPGLVLLAESFATAINFYFLFLLLKNQRFSSSKAIDVMNLRGLPLIMRKRFREVYTSSQLFEGELYFSFCKDIWNVYKFILNHTTNRKYASKGFNLELVEFLRALENPWLPASYDIANNIFYVTALCGKKSLKQSLTRADQFFKKGNFRCKTTFEILKNISRL